MTDRLEALGRDPIEGMARIATDEAADIKHPGTDVQGTRGLHGLAPAGVARLNVLGYGADGFNVDALLVGPS